MNNRSNLRKEDSPIHQKIKKNNNAKYSEEYIRLAKKPGQQICPESIIRMFLSGESLE